MATADNITLKNNFGEQTQNQIIAQANGLVLSFPGGGGLFAGLGVPSFSADAGSLYMRQDPAGVATTLYINPTSGNHWAAMVSA